MLKRFLFTSLLINLFFCSYTQAQKKDSLHYQLLKIYSQVDSLFNSTDSSVVDLIDTFLQPNKIKDTSRLMIRLGYNSNISAMNQSLGIKQYGLSPGLAYYHKSGLYADVSSYWSKQFSPSLYLTIFSAGFMKAVSPTYLLNAEYSYYLYPNNGQDVSASYTNSISITNQLTLKPIALKLDYYYYFGAQSAHRILPGISFTIEKKNWGKIHRLLFYPTFSILFGTESTVQYIPVSNQVALDRLKNGGSLYDIKTITIFGLMNYSFTLPVSARTTHWNFQLSYTYNIPRSLPDEELGLGNTSYVSLGVARYIKLK